MRLTEKGTARVEATDGMEILREALTNAKSQLLSAPFHVFTRKFEHVWITWGLDSGAHFPSECKDIAQVNVVIARNRAACGLP